MIKPHKISLRQQKAVTDNLLTEKVIMRSAKIALRAEKINVPCEVNVLVTDDTGIKKINRDFRGIDAPTDVLSFPLHELVPGNFQYDKNEVDRQTKRLLLGDIILSADTIRKHAFEYGNTIERETAYIVIHSVLHLLGYDHMDEAVDKRQMRIREKTILEKTGVK